MKVILPLLILLIASAGIYMHLSNITNTEHHFEDEEFQEDLEQGSLVFKADVNCQLGSRYIMGVGCEETIFTNAWQLKDQVQQRPITRVEIKSFRASSSSELNAMTSHRASIEGGGWGVKVKAGLDMLNKNHETVNAVSVDLTDYRLHFYNYVNAAQFELDENDANDFQDDPQFFFEQHGYYFVIGFSTGSTFDGVLNYRSENKEVLKDVSFNIGASYGYGPFSVGGSYAYNNMKETKNGDAYKLNVTGSNNDIWDENDIKGAHDKFQETINKNQMLSVSVTKWDSIRSLRDAIRNMGDDAKNRLREFSKVNSSFLQKISASFSMYLYLQQMISQHIIGVGASLTPQQLQVLKDLKTDIDKRVDRIQDMRYIQDVSDLNNNKYTDDLVEYEFKSVEVEKTIKQITNRID